MKQQYKSSFSSRISCVVTKEKDRYLSAASLEQLRKFLPNIDLEKDHDVLGISFNACVVNRANLNQDGITTDTALKIYKGFINRPIDLEHNIVRVIGTITTAGFTEFGSDKPLSEEEVKDLKGPFNIALGGLIWRRVNNKVAEILEDSADPGSANYLKISASWEIGFTDYNLCVIKGSSKNFEDGKIISDPVEIDKLKNNLIALGGTGKTANDERIYRVITENAIALGIGLTETPAADVKGIFVETPPEDEETAEATENNQTTISQQPEEDVNQISTNMKITSVKDITDENLKVVKASAITDFIEQEIKSFNDKYTAEKGEKEKELSAANDKISATQKDLDASKADLAKLQEKVTSLEATISAKAKEEAFSARMAEFDAEYDLDDEDRKVLTPQIKNLDDAGYTAFKATMATLLKEKNKKVKKAAAEAAAKTEKEKQEATASDEAAKKAAADAAKNALNKDKELPNTSEGELTLKDKFAKAFAPENIVIKKR